MGKEVFVPASTQSMINVKPPHGSAVILERGGPEISQYFGTARLCALDEHRCRVFEITDEPSQEFRCSGAIVHPVVERQRKGKNFPDNDPVSLDPGFVGDFSCP